MIYKLVILFIIVIPFKLVFSIECNSIFITAIEVRKIEQKKSDDFKSNPVDLALEKFGDKSRTASLLMLVFKDKEINIYDYRFITEILESTEDESYSSMKLFSRKLAFFKELPFPLNEGSLEYFNYLKRVLGIGQAFTKIKLLSKIGRPLILTETNFLIHIQFIHRDHEFKEKTMRFLFYSISSTGPLTEGIYDFLNELEGYYPSVYTRYTYSNQLLQFLYNYWDSVGLFLTEDLNILLTLASESRSRESLIPFIKYTHLKSINSYDLALLVNILYRSNTPVDKVLEFFDYYLLVRGHLDKDTFESSIELLNQVGFTSFKNYILSDPTSL